MSGTAESRPPPLSSWTIAAYFAAGNLVPSLGMLVTVTNYGGPAWQNGRFHDFAWLLFNGPSAGVFCPFLLYSTACFTLALLRPETVARHFSARLGLYTGIVLALHACIVGGILVLKVKDLNTPSGIATVALTVPLICIGVALTVMGAWRLGASLKRAVSAGMQTQTFLVLLMFAPSLAAICFGLLMSEDAVSALMMLLVVAPGLIIFGLAPCWYLAANIAMTVRIFRLRDAGIQFRIWHLLAVMTWLAAYMAAWRFAIHAALKAYAALPVEPPSGCYVATAAAGGHRRIVQCRELKTASGSTVRVNAQLAYLKCGEIVLQTTWPQLHRALRRVYNHFGPPLARRLCNPWLGDAAYLSLKPLEWTVRAVLALLVPAAQRLAAEFYCRPGGAQEDEGERNDGFRSGAADNWPADPANPTARPA